MGSIFEKIFKKLHLEKSRQPQESSDGQKAIAKLLKLTGCTDLRIDEQRQVYFVKDGKAHWAMLKPDKDRITIYGTKVMFKTGGRDLSWKDISPELCDRLVLESLCGTFFGEFPRGVVALIPMANSIAELMLKLDMVDSIFVSHKELGSTFAAPNWLNRYYKERFQA